MLLTFLTRAVLTPAMPIFVVVAIHKVASLLALCFSPRLRTSTKTLHQSPLKLAGTPQHRNTSTVHRLVEGPTQLAHQPGPIVKVHLHKVVALIDAHDNPLAWQLGEDLPSWQVLRAERDVAAHIVTTLICPNDVEH